MSQTLPAVLVIAGLDPSGGAGILADVQTISTLNCHCATVITTNTVQDSSRLYQSNPVASDILEQQLRRLESDFHFSAIKIGALGSISNARVVAQYIQQITTQNPSTAVILDPVLKATDGNRLSHESLIQTLLDEILPYCTLITPNEPELLALTGHSSSQQAVNQLASLGASVLVTGGHNRDSNNHRLENTLVIGRHQQGQSQQWSIPLINGEFRGTGCTLSSAIAGYMAHGHPLTEAIIHAQSFVSHTLENAYTLPSGQRVPLRSATIPTT